MSVWRDPSAAICRVFQALKFVLPLFCDAN